MRLDKRDMVFAALVIAVLDVIVSLSGKETTKAVPNDAHHRPVYQTAYAAAPDPGAPLLRRVFFKADRKGAERSCEPCHRARNVPFPPNHPPKHRCLLCHKLLPKQLPVKVSSSPGGLSPVMLSDLSSRRAYAHQSGHCL